MDGSWVMLVTHDVCKFVVANAVLGSCYYLSHPRRFLCVSRYSSMFWQFVFIGLMAWAAFTYLYPNGMHGDNDADVDADPPGGAPFLSLFPAARDRDARHRDRDRDSVVSWYDSSRGVSPPASVNAGVNASTPAARSTIAARRPPPGPRSDAAAMAPVVVVDVSSGRRHTVGSVAAETGSSTATAAVLGTCAGAQWIHACLNFSRSLCGVLCCCCFLFWIWCVCVCLFLF